MNGRPGGRNSPSRSSGRSAGGPRGDELAELDELLAAAGAAAVDVEAPTPATGVPVVVAEPSARNGGGSVHGVTTASRRAAATRRPRRRRLGRPSGAGLLAFVYLAWTLLPLIVMARLSLNAGTEVGAFGPISADRFSSDGGVLNTRTDLGAALQSSLRLAALTALIAVPIGTVVATGSLLAAQRRARQSVRRPAREAVASLGVLSFAGAVVPTVLIGALAVVVTRSLLAEGTAEASRSGQQLLAGHVVFATALVALVARSWLRSLPAAIDVARDLGASPVKALTAALRPHLAPLTVVGAAVAVAASIDDLGVAAVVAAAGGSPNSTLDTLDTTASQALYDGVLSGPTAPVFATATVVAVVALSVAGVASAVVAAARRRHGLTPSGFATARLGA